MLWLSVLAGSLALHLVLLLVGRWYLSQSAESLAGGGSQAPLDFVEIDPNGPPLKRAIAPSSTAKGDALVPKAAPEAASPEQSQSASITNFNRQVTPEQSQRAIAPQPEQRKSPDLLKPTQPDLQSSDSSQTAPAQSTRGTTTTPPNANSSSRPSPSSNAGSNSSQNGNNSSQPGNGSATTTNPNPSGTSSSQGNPSQTNDPSSNNSQNPNPNSPNSSPATSSNKLPSGGLPGEGSFGGQLLSLELDPNAKQDDGALSVAFATTKIPPIQLPVTAPQQPLDLRITVTIDNSTGEVVGSTVRKDSPTLQASPELEDAAQTISYNLLQAAGKLFDVVPKSQTDPAFSSRVITLRIDGKTIQISR
jgi:hypothetical protein